VKDHVNRDNYSKIPNCPCFHVEETTPPVANDIPEAPWNPCHIDHNLSMVNGEK